jgi:uncharacterized damage-inducible protein DinB
MNSIEHLRELYEYNDWANRRLVRALKETDCQKALKYLAHVLITEKEYYERLYGKDSTGFDFHPELSVDECSELARETAELYERLLKRFDEEGLGQTVRYYTSAGEPVENTFREVLTHVLLHSMNHRGQALTVLRLESHAPPVLDYIIYRRSVRKN